jgi:hypothetical protein
MSVMTLTPRNWFSSNFSVLDDERRLADVHLSRWRERGALTIAGVEYTVSRETLLGDFLLKQAGSVLARATRPSAFRRSFILRYKEQSYTLRAKSAFQRTFVLLDGGEHEIGSIVLENCWTRKSLVTLPDDWPLPAKSFAMWLTIVQWNRDAG